MASLNTGWSARFKATQTQDIYKVRLIWNNVSAAGQVTIRIETDSSGKPSGTLYDANAVLTAVVPVAGSQLYTFSTPPATGLTIDSIYHVVILTTTGGTTQTLASHAAPGALGSTYPVEVLTAADGTTRTNFAEVAGTVARCSLVLADGTDDSMGMIPASTTVNTNLITSGGTVVVAGLKLITDVTLRVSGVEFMVVKTGTPTANLRCRIYNSANSLVTNSTIVISVNSLLTGAATRRGVAMGFAGGVVISLPPDTYRVVFDGAADTSGVNCWVMKGTTPFGATSVPSGFSMTTAPNIASPVWTDTTDQVPVRLILDDVLVPASAEGYSRSRTVFA